MNKVERRACLAFKGKRQRTPCHFRKWVCLFGYPPLALFKKRTLKGSAAFCGLRFRSLATPTFRDPRKPEKNTYVPMAKQITRDRPWAWVVCLRPKLHRPPQKKDNTCDKKTRIAAIKSINPRRVPESFRRCFSQSRGQVLEWLEPKRFTV